MNSETQIKSLEIVAVEEKHQTLKNKKNLYLLLSAIM